MPTAESPPAEAQQLTGSSSSRVTSRPPAAAATQADVGDEGRPDEFKEFTDQQLQSKITRLRALRFRTADGGEKARRMVHLVEKELDRRRAAGLTKDEGDANELKNSTDQDLRLKTKRLRAPDGSKPSSAKKLRKVEKELDRHHDSGVETGQSQAAQTPNVDDPYAFVQQGENTSNHAPPIDSKATDGGLNPFASTNPEGEGATGTNLGAEVEPTTSTCSGQKGQDTGKRDEHSQNVVRETNLEFKIKKTQELVEEVKEIPKQENRFTIEKCVAVLEEIKELTDMEKAKALKLFKCKLNREIFMTTKSATVLLIWLKSEIYA